jgi:hypothetical protein
MPGPGPALSIVLASIDASSTIRAALDALRLACADLPAEIVVADASADGTADIARRFDRTLTVLQYAPRTLVPQLWAAGLAHCHAPRVAFTTAEFRVPPTWARVCLDTLDAGAAAVGGPLALAHGLDATSAATFYLRYSTFLEPGTPGGPAREVEHLPGENTAYVRDRILESRAPLDLGFWEAEINQVIRRAGGRLISVPEARATFHPSASFRSIARSRFAHGRHCGAGRVSRGERQAWQIVAAAPLVPFVLASRIARRVLRLPGHRLRFLGALPSLLTLAGAWSAGEAWGALRGSGLTPMPHPARAS